jgi:hypothetical protein
MDNKVVKDIRSKTLAKKFIVGIMIFSTLVLLCLASYFALQTKTWLDGAIEVKGESLKVDSYEGKCGKEKKKCTLHRSTIKFDKGDGQFREEVLEGDYMNQKDLDLLYNSSADIPLRLKNESFWIIPIVLVIVAILDITVILPLLLYNLKR